VINGAEGYFSHIDSRVFFWPSFSCANGTKLYSARVIPLKDLDRNLITIV
jgi:hypothetical protein